ncbi:MAG: IS66 family insertion sequence element accessory protein TnpA [Steroidobacteraceae bacterium]
MRRRRSEQAWSELVRQQSQSGLSVQAFCRREGLNAWTFYGWRSRLRAGAAGEESAVIRSAVTEPASGFIDLGALRPCGTRCEIRLDLGGGVVLQVVRG